MAHHKIIGIDLGTTFSVVSSLNEETGKPEAFEVPGMQPPRVIFPSVISISRQGKILVGWPAKRNLPANPQNTIIEVKRKMGDPDEVPLGGQKFSPQMISAMVLSELKRIAEAKIGSPIHDAVITVPAHFSDLRRQATEDAARIAQLNPRLLINEPTAAAIAYGLDKLTDEERIFVVYDLGGGTFDVSVILVAGTTIEVMGTAGDDQLGGGDFDYRLTEWVFNQIEKDFPGSGDLRGRPDLWARVQAMAEQAKIDLAGTDVAVIDVPNFTPDINVNYEVDRATFIALIQEPRPRPNRKEPIGLLDETIVSVTEAFESAKRNFQERYHRDVTMDDVTEFLLVGGSTRIPAVKEMLEARFNKPVRFDPEIVDKAVSLGAAIMGRTMVPMDAFEGEMVEVPRQVGVGQTQGEMAISQLGVVDVTGHSLGIILVGDRFHRLINKDTELPHEVTHEGFTTATDNQTGARIAVFQGEDPVAPNNTLLGELPIDNLEPRPMGFHLFDVTFSLDISGVLGLQVKHSVRDNSRAPQTYTAVLKSEGVRRLSREEVMENRRRMQQLLEGGFGSAMPTQRPPVTSSTVPQGGYQTAPQPQPTAAHQPQPYGSYQPQPTAPPQPTVPPQPASSQPTAAPPLSPDGDLEAKIPEDFRDTWRRARQRVAALEGARQQMLQTALQGFEQAVQAGDQAAIHDYGRAMIETYFSIPQ